MQQKFLKALKIIITVSLLLGGLTICRDLLSLATKHSHTKYKEELIKNFILGSDTIHTVNGDVLISVRP